MSKEVNRSLSLGFSPPPWQVPGFLLCYGSLTPRMLPGILFKKYLGPMNKDRNSTHSSTDTLDLLERWSWGQQIGRGLAGYEGSPTNSQPQTSAVKALRSGFNSGGACRRWTKCGSHPMSKASVGSVGAQIENCCPLGVTCPFPLRIRCKQWVSGWLSWQLTQSG